jgi:hypothetical protein
LAQAVVPAPDGGYAGGNTAEGSSALLSLTTGTFNTAVGFLSLKASMWDLTRPSVPLRLFPIPLPAPTPP